jgi:hypothetical protein
MPNVTILSASRTADKVYGMRVRDNSGPPNGLAVGQVVGKPKARVSEPERA